MISELISNRKQILFIELAGLLHDIGKLSKAFLEYRQKWQNDPNGWYNDPHEKKFLDNHEVFNDQVPTEFKKHIPPGKIDFGAYDLSIKKAIDFHIEPGNDLILKMLKAADGLDSAIDRNNPLWSAEQKDSIFKSNVFGYEGNCIVTLESQEKARQELYAFLRGRLTDYFERFDCKARNEILKGIKKAFEQGLGDTTRPQNDTTLWEHSYAVASILKVLAVHYILCNEKLDNMKKVRFGVFGIGWDGMRFLSYGHKISDIIGRKRIIADVKKKLKMLIEYEIPVGNEIYSDDDGIYFIVPAGFKDYGQVDELKELRTNIENNIYKLMGETSSGELQPHIVDISETNTLTSLVSAIQRMKKKTAYPFDSSVNEFGKYFESHLKNFEHGKTICPVCRLRAVRKEDDEKKICSVCEERRTRKTDTEHNKCITGNNETLFIDEIVDGNRKAALIVARFGLNDWLKGKMVRTLFVTEANGIEREIENLGNVKHFEDIENKIKNNIWPFFESCYQQITDDIDSFGGNSAESIKRAKCIAFLYDRRHILEENDVNPSKIYNKWLDIRDSVIEEMEYLDSDKFNMLLYNILCAKTPTPSTLFDVWNTTLNFLEDVPANILRSLLPEKRRLKLKTDRDDLKPLKYRGTLDAEVVLRDGTVKNIEVLIVSRDEIEVISETSSGSSNLGDWIEAEITISDPSLRFKVSEYREGSFLVPFRTITATPNLFMAIVPADKAIEITDLVYRKYVEHFGKVMGRLPFSIGNIFFGRKMPMFVVLDSGKRMVDNFDNLSKEGMQFTVLEDKKDIASDAIFDLKCTLGKLGRSRVDKTVTWRLPSKLGNCEDDFHHPYFIVDNKTGLLENRKTFFKTIAGSVIHFSEIEAGDELLVYPNYYDFEFLDTNTRRYDINLDTDKRRKSNVADFKSKPFLLDELGQKIMCLWPELLQGKQLKGITDTKLRNLQSLWLTKYQEWEVDICNKSSENYRRWIALVLSSIQKEFDTIDVEHCALLQETIENGLFFDTLELYLGILKQRIEAK